MSNASSVSRIVPPGAPPLQREGEPIRSIYLVERGHLQITKTTLICTTFGENSLLGLELLGENAHEKTPIAQFTALVPQSFSPCTVREFTVAEFRQFAGSEASCQAHATAYKRWILPGIAAARDRVINAKQSGTRAIDPNNRRPAIPPPPNESSGHHSILDSYDDDTDLPPTKQESVQKMPAVSGK